MSPRHNPQYRLERKARRKTGYPVATIAYYGPDDSRASKAVVGIVTSEQSSDVAVLRKWQSDLVDVRTDPTIMAEILAFLDQHHVQRVGIADRMIGCPHEEGIDYPQGETCPRCPYWANRDRWTGEQKTWAGK